MLDASHLQRFTRGWFSLFQCLEASQQMRLKFCQFGELEVLWCVEVFVRKAYMVDAAETRFARVMHSVKTIILQKLQIINHLKFYPLQGRRGHCQRKGLN